MPHHFRRAGVALFAATLVVAACGDDDATTATGDPAATLESTTSMDDSVDGHADHDAIDLAGNAVVPTVAITVTPDARAGANLHLTTTDFTFTPEHASGTNADVTGDGPVQGHGHVYVDGVKIGRIYGDWMFLDLDPGTHEVTVDLNANDHSPYVVDGEPIAATASVDVAESGVAHEHGSFAAEDPVPTVSVEVTADAMAGWNVHVETTDFTFTPELASEDATTSGEGHAHLFVDGEKVTRLYGSWFHVGGPLTAGEHEFRVELSANDHAAYVDADGATIAAVTTVTVGEDEAADPSTDTAAHDHDDDHDHGEGGSSGLPDGTPADSVIEMTVLEGAVSPGGRQSVAVGDVVLVRVTSDVADEVHIHGYDLSADVDAGDTVEITFVADIPGVFEVEFEQSGIALFDLQVS